MERVILHFDMDYFFAQIEERENPQFKGKPVVVGADPRGGKGRGVVATANYDARKYGIKSGMPISKAYKLCPDAIFLPVNIELYQKVSERIMEIVKKYSPICEIVSLDEAYLDLTEYSNMGPSRRLGGRWAGCSLKNIGMFKEKVAIERSYKKVESLAKKLKEEIFEKEKLTCTVGIGPNKLVAKIATNFAKPNGLLVLLPEKVEKFLEPLNIEEIPGIGPKTAQKLRKIGIEKIKDLKKLSKSKLKEMFGKVGEWFFEAARGIDEKPVKNKEKAKSIGRQITFERDTRDPKTIFESFDQISKEVFEELKQSNFFFKIITVICRYSDFETHAKSKTLKEKSQDFQILKKEAKRLLLKFLLESKKKIRLIGLRIKVC